MPLNIIKMKRLFLLSVLLATTFVVSAQTNLSGTYGYSFPTPANTGNDKKATGPSGSLVLLKMDGNKYRFWLSVTIGWPNYHIGETDGTISFVNDTASFDNSYEDAEQPCILKFKIAGNTININSMSSSFNCGFGNGVNADGDYTLLKLQPVMNNEWFKKQYYQTTTIIITSKKAEIFQDENCLRPFSKSYSFIKDDSLMNIAETEKTVYTEFITSSGKFIYGWLRKTDVKLIDSE